MRRIGTWLAVAVISIVTIVVGLAQSSTDVFGIKFTYTDPGGNCTSSQSAQLWVSVGTGKVFSCQNGVITQVGAALSLVQWTTPGVKTSNGAAFITAQTRLFDFVLPGSITATKIDYSVTTADNTATTYDLGIYSNTGTLLCHLGATAGTTFAPSTGTKTATFLSTGCPLVGGVRYLFAMTASTATASLASTGNILMAQAGATPSSGNATSGGALNASITPAADAPGDTNGFPEFRLHN